MSLENPFEVDPRVDRPTPEKINPDVTKPNESFVAPGVVPGLQKLIPGVRERIPFSKKHYPKYGPGRGNAEGLNVIGDNNNPSIK